MSNAFFSKWRAVDFMCAFFWRTFSNNGFQHDKGSGLGLKTQYEAQDLNMLAAHATHAEGGNGVEAGLMEMLDRMHTGRLKVFSNLANWFEEFRLYHRKEGKIVKERDDLMSATRYAIMMLRFAETEPNTDGGGKPGGAGGWMAG